MVPAGNWTKGNFVDKHLHNPGGNYMFKVNNINSRISCKICSKLTKKTPEQRHWSGVVLVSLLLTLNTFHTLF